jgi:hypothetical protein
MDTELMELHKKAALSSGKERACEGKINFKSEETADKAAARLNKKTDRPNFHLLEAYPCPFCEGWHIGRKFILSGRTMKIWNAEINSVENGAEHLIEEKLFTTKERAFNWLNDNAKRLSGRELVKDDQDKVEEGKFWIFSDHAYYLSDRELHDR